MEEIWQGKALAYQRNEEGGWNSQGVRRGPDQEHQERDLGRILCRKTLYIKAIPISDHQGKDTCTDQHSHSFNEDGGCG